MKAASWEAANPGKSQALKKARRKMIKDDVSDKFMERGHHPYQVYISSPNPKAAPLPGRHGSVARAATSTLQGNGAAFQVGNVPLVLPKPQANDVTATKEKASSGNMSNAIQEPAIKNDSSHKELPAAKTSEYVSSNEEVRHQARAGAKKARKVLHDAGEATAILRGIKDILEAYLSGVAAQHALDELHEQPAPPGQ
ncbi:uncharacterized protein PG998_013088 [Apiospora kogelbergensis]|uniref:uncharacterized protein n=1 Tax=Apiospora kogelbergensis TaxID=1337665 RepID=UPI0031326656